MNRAKIWGIGLPRCAGQTLQQAICILTKKDVWHSLGRGWARMGEDAAGAVEVWQPVPWLEKMYPGSLYILNTRNEITWYKSCQSVYEKSVAWNNPLWCEPLPAFFEYRKQYEAVRSFQLREHHDRLLVWDIVARPEWEPLCKFLNVPVPSEPFPRKDKFGVNQPQQQQITGPAIDWLGVDFTETLL